MQPVQRPGFPHGGRAQGKNQDGSDLDRQVQELHPKLARELRRGDLQHSLVARLLEDEGSADPRPAVLVGASLVDIETGEVLESQPGQNPAYYVAAMHALAADPRYRWVGFRRGSDNRGEPDAVPLSGAVHMVSDRIDPSYQARLRNRARRQIREGLSRTWTLLRASELLVQRWKERFITLTLPHRDSATRLGDWKSFNGAFERLRDTTYWRKAVFGGFKNLEDPGIEEPHVHAHLIAIAKWLGQVSLAWEWTGAVVAQFRSESGEPFADPRQVWMDKGWNLKRILELEDSVPRLKKKLRKSKCRAEAEYWEAELGFVSGLLAEVRKDLFIVDIRLVGGSNSPTTIEREEAIQEVCKYVTKTSDLVKLRKDELLGLVLPGRAPRVFDAFGACRGRQEAVDAIQEALEAANEAAGTAASASLDTAAIMSGSPVGTDPQNPSVMDAPEVGTDPDPPEKRKRPPSWRALMKELSLEDFIRVMRTRAERNSGFAFMRLKEVGIMAWSVAQVLEMGECPVPF